MENVAIKEYFLNLTPGKLNGLRAITDEEGKFKVLALDQSNSFRKSLSALFAKNNNPHEPSYEEIRDAKLEITSKLSLHATAVLLDVNYGLAQAIYNRVINRESALIGRLEASRDAGTSAELEPGWSVAGIKKIGCSAVKLLVYMDITDEEYTAKQLDFVKQISQDCQKEDILLMVEELTFSHEGEDKNSPQFIFRKTENIIQSAKLLGPFCDILKLEFVGNDRLEELNSVCVRPWVLLSAGQPYNDFVLQVKSAMEAGASGIMAGRAIFNDYFTLSDESAKKNFLEGLASSRMAELNRIVDESAVSWMQKAGITNEQLGQKITQGWYKNTTSESVSTTGEY